jgi:multiple sugar transport system permease protein
MDSRQIARIDFLKKNGLKLVTGIARTILFALLSFVIIFPLFREFATMFMMPEDLYDASVTYIPKHFTFDNVVMAARLLDLKKTYPLTILYVFSIAILQMLSTTVVGYGLARFKFKINGILLFLAIVSIVLPHVILQIPLYALFRNFRLFGLIPLINDGIGLSFINTPIPMTFLSITCSGFRCGFYILIMRQYYRTMPIELEEAAYIDGAGPFKAFIRVMLPSSVTMMITIFLFSFVWTWLDTTYTDLFMGKIPVLSNVSRALNGVESGGAKDEVTRNLIAYAGVIFLIVPLIILYLFTQKFFVQSIERSGLVG